jgi:hypothetical protein
MGFCLCEHIFFSEDAEYDFFVKEKMLFIVENEGGKRGKQGTMREAPFPILQAPELRTSEDFFFLDLTLAGRIHDFLVFRYCFRHVRVGPTTSTRNLSSVLRT